MAIERTEVGGICAFESEKNVTLFQVFDQFIACQYSWSCLSFSDVEMADFHCAFLKVSGMVDPGGQGKLYS